MVTMHILFSSTSSRTIFCFASISSRTPMVIPPGAIQDCSRRVTKRLYLCVSASMNLWCGPSYIRVFVRTNTASATARMRLMTASTFSIAANWVTINVRIGSHGLMLVSPRLLRSLVLGSYSERSFPVTERILICNRCGATWIAFDT